MHGIIDSSNYGIVTSICGSVVNVRFEKFLPPVYSLLRAGNNGSIAIEVLAQLGENRVRGIALTPNQGLARGMKVEYTGGPIKVPVGRNVLSRMFNVFGEAIDGGAAPSNVELRPIHQ